MFDFSKFSDVGDYLSLKNCEENNRSAISRYYYSVFGSVRMYLVLFLNEFDYEWDKFDEDYFKKNLVKVRNNSKLALDEVESLKKSPPFKF